MSEFADWLKKLGINPDLANLTAQQHEALEDRHGYLHSAHSPCVKGSLTCAAIKAGEDFKEKYE